MTSRGQIILRRIAAYLADIVILFAFVAASQALLVVSGLHPFIGDDKSDAPPAGLLHLWVIVSTTVPFLAYFTLAFASRRGATLGQRAASVRVRTVSGARLSPPRAFVRAVVLLIPFELNHAAMLRLAPWAGGSDVSFMAAASLVWVLIATYLLLMLLRRDGRSAHDLAAGSIVEAAPAAATQALRSSESAGVR